MTVTEDLAFLSSLPAYVRQMQPYKPGKPIEELKAEYGFETVIKLASNENPFGPSPKAIEAATKGLSETFRYPDPVSRRLRQKIADRFGIQPEEIVVGAGSESLLATVVRTMLHPGDETLTGFGAFMGFAIHLSAHGGVLKTVPSPDYRFDIDGLLAAITPKTRILYLPNPNNPTGTYFTQAQLEKITATVPDSTLILLDEAYIEFCGHLSDYPDSLATRKPNVLVLRTFSKAYGLAGFRIGYGIGHPKLIEQLTKVKMTFEPSMPAQLAAEAAWDDHDFLKKGADNNRQELARYYGELRRLGFSPVESAGNFVFVPSTSADYVNRLNEALLQRGIAIRPLGPFGFSDAFRITVGLPQENDALFAALAEILPEL